MMYRAAAVTTRLRANYPAMRTETDRPAHVDPLSVISIARWEDDGGRVADMAPISMGLSGTWFAPPVVPPGA